MSGLTRAPVSSAAPVLGRAPARASRRANRSAARDFAAGARISRSSLAGRSRDRKKILSDYPRGLAHCLWLRGFAVPDPLPVSSALAVPFLLARRRRPITLLGLPPRPLPRRFPAALAAIALLRLPRMKTLLTSFQQTASHPRPAGQTFPPADLLLFAMACRILGRAHGRSRLPEAPALEGNALLSGAQQTSGSLQNPHSN